MDSIGPIVRRHRLLRNWTQAELAGALGRTNQTSISQLENERESWLGRQRFDDLAKLFDYPDDLIEWWVDDRQSTIEETIRYARGLRELLTQRSRPSTAVEKIDKLIEEFRRVNSDLVVLRQQLLEGGSADG